MVSAALIKGKQQFSSGMEVFAGKAGLATDVIRPRKTAGERQQKVNP
jgi:hypothetical protein